MIWQRNTIAALLALVFGYAALIHAEPAADKGDAPADSQPRLAAKAGLYRGTDNCERCHTAPRTGDPAVPNHVRLNEAALWKNEDLHYLAYDHLRQGLGKKIGERLNANVLDPATGCLQCHTTSESIARLNLTKTNEHAEGVGCEACHGPSERWVGKHNVYDEWQRESPDAKTADGWIDIRSPQSRAEVCLSCHSGSPPDSRVITHAMYAAGHPPLAGFEIESFANLMPRHWRHPYEKPNFPGQSFDRTRDILTASVVALRMSLELSVADATAAKQPERWPEFARLDCFACHHDIGQSDWRQGRSGTFAPGRPRLTIGCLPLVAIAARAVQGKNADPQLEDLKRQLQAPFESNYFGDPSKIAQESPSIIASCSDLERQLDATPLTPDTALNVLHSIARESIGEYHDFDTARQLFGAWAVVYQELIDNRVLPSSLAADETIASGRALFNFENRKPGQPAASQPEQRSVAEKLPALFDNRTNYDPTKFTSEMSKLDALTTTPPTSAQ